MQRIVLVVFLTVNLVALLCLLNPWYDQWAGAALLLLVVEAVALVLIGLPLFVHHRRKGLPSGAALSASLDTVLTFLTGWA